MSIPILNKTYNNFNSLTIEKENYLHLISYISATNFAELIWKRIKIKTILIT